jgi:hypothetical protein
VVVAGGKVKQGVSLKLQLTESGELELENGVDAAQHVKRSCQVPKILFMDSNYLHIGLLAVINGVCTEV